MTARKRKNRPGDPEFSRRERQIMDILYRLGEATVGAVLRELPDPPSYSAIRSTMSILVDKGHAEYRMDRNRYVYSPTVSPGVARGRALAHVVETFFEASPTKVVSALLEDRDRLTDDELEELARLVEQARSEGR